MKKLIPALCLLLLLSLCLSPLALAADGNYDTLAQWDIRIHVPDGKNAALQGDAYYIYALDRNTIPYVMLVSFRYDSLDAFLDDFTDYMREQYADLEVSAAAHPLRVGDKDCREIVYTYSVSGYEARDRRLAFRAGERVYLFCSKEIDALGLSVGSMLEDVVADCVVLGGETGSPAATADEPEELGELGEQGLASAYVYRLDNGMPKYWLDLSGTMSDSPVLHCMFRSGDPTFYESCFILSIEDAEATDDRLVFHTVTDMRGFDHSAWFKKLELVEAGDALMLVVKRDESTLAGGADDNILSGNYLLNPMGLGLLYEYRQSDGMLKYWFDTLGGALTLHAMFRSGEPEFHEERFSFDLDSAEPDGAYGLSIRKVIHQSGIEVSDWFESLTIGNVQGAILMNVKRNERSLAGGADDNILSGVYLFEPRSFLLPAGEAPYSPEQLAEAAQLYYLRNFGFFPPEADAQDNGDGSFTIHLYEIVGDHTATSAWYTVDAFGEGADDIFGTSVSLRR